MIKPSVTIGLTNPKSPTNVGAVMRAAGCFAANAVNYTGQRYERAAKYQTDTKNQLRHIPLTGVDCLVEAAPENAKIICVDLVEGAIALPDFQHPENACYIFGPEDGTIEQAVIDQADYVVYIPTYGCLNLAMSVNVVLYDRVSKLNSIQASDELVCNSRDRNNKVKVSR
ncbi:RNA methyltransferase [Catenovulum sp. 2E275]|uniref:RNA methyltransferase n=1 Tax=Catenovulum sp. 2E275 TaxID=2980497 RepID=UPI0021D14F21|nr:RNA methyltransferase [Catenovulum sp. 2E275]MCU4675449.1 RNA methyltransferase [Catenovulum sp. 2E275]